MGYRRLAYDEVDQAVAMRRDCDAVIARMCIADRVHSPAPLRRPEHPARVVPRRDLRVTDATAHLASTLHLHLD